MFQFAARKLLLVFRVVHWLATFGNIKGGEDKYTFMSIMGELNAKILIQTLEEHANLQCGDIPSFPHKISTEFADYLNSMKWWLGNAMPKHILEIAKTTEIQQFAWSSLAYSPTK